MGFIPPCRQSTQNRKRPRPIALSGARPHMQSVVMPNDKSVDLNHQEIAEFPELRGIGNLQHFLAVLVLYDIT